MQEIGKQDTTITPGIEAPGDKVRLQIFKCASTVSDMQSAVGYMHKLARVEQTADMQKGLSLLLMV